MDRTVSSARGWLFAASCATVAALGCGNSIIESQEAAGSAAAASGGACGNACPDAPNAMPACTHGSCTFACDAGWGDCNGSIEDGCEHDTTADNHNCGGCGHDCLGGACSNGLCPVEQLATGETLPWTVAIDDLNVYWPALAGLRTVPKSGGTVTTIGPVPGGTVGQIAAAAGAIVWGYHTRRSMR